MTFKTAILALGPTIYWECAQATGPVAVDSSGNSNPGAFYGNYALSQPGVATGEFSALFLNGGGVRTPAQSPRAVRPYAYMCFFAIGLPGSLSAGIVGNGNGGIDGSALIFGTASSVSQAIRLLHGGQGVSADTGALSFNTWHHLACSESLAGNTIVWIDNAQVINTAGNNPINPGASSPFQANSPIAAGSIFFAHIALFPNVLSNANVNSVYTASAFAAPGPILAIGPGDISTIIADLTALQTSVTAILAAVRHTFPTTT